MPRKRLSGDLWRGKRLKVLERDGYTCTRCKVSLTKQTAHIDHIKSGKLGTNEMSNLRALCNAVTAYGLMPDIGG
jgi:5-methylcytosine-specific restriction endonuclease McrA